MLLAIAATLMLALAFTADVDAAKGGNPGKPPDDPTPPPALTNPAFPFVAEDDTRPRPYRQLCLTNSDGSITEQLTFDIYQESIPEWSPDGTRIAYARAQDGDMYSPPWCGGIYARNADGTGGEELLFDLCEDTYPLYLWTANRLPWSPDNRMLIGAQGPVSLDPGIYEIDLATGDVRNIVPSLTPGLLDRAVQAAWSPNIDDSTPGYQGEIAVCGTKYSQDSPDSPVVAHRTGIYILDPESGALKRSIPGTDESDGRGCQEGGTQTDWSPDGEWLLYSMVDNGQGGQLLRSRADGTGQPTVLAAGFGIPSTSSWSPDSALISLVADHEVRKNKDQRDLFYMSADGSGMTNVTNSARRELDQDWNPERENDL